VVSLYKIGWMLMATDQPEQAVGRFERAVGIAERLAALDETNARAHTDLAVLRRVLAQARAAAGEGGAK